MLWVTRYAGNGTLCHGTQHLQLKRTCQPCTHTNQPALESNNVKKLHAAAHTDGWNRRPELDSNLPWSRGIGMDTDAALPTGPRVGLDQGSSRGLDRQPQRRQRATGAHSTQDEANPNITMVVALKK